MKKMRTWAGLLLALAAIILTSCAEKDLPPKQENGVLVYACMNPQNSRIQSYVKLFNNTHEDVQIELRDYSGEEGVQRLRVELAAGRVPDIMDLYYFGDIVGSYWSYTIPTVSDAPEGEYWMPYRQLVQKGYLEDLWPYIENDPYLGRDGVLEAPLKAAEVNGGLYAAFGSVRIDTLVGTASQVGDRTSWTFQELQDAFAAMPEGATVFRFDTSREEVAYHLLLLSMEDYVDWETGTCSFDSPGFRSMLEFIGQFPTRKEVDEETAAFADLRALLTEAEERSMKGLQMLDNRATVTLRWLPTRNAEHGGQCAFAQQIAE